MLETGFPFVAELTIARLVGPLPHSRGHGYARDGRVTSLTWDAVAQVLTGSVQGTQVAPYQVAVTLSGAPTPRTMVHHASCSCPVAINCKHAAAVLYASNERHAAAAERAASDRADGSGWRATVAALDAAAMPVERSLKPLALQFELRRRSPHRNRTRVGGGDEAARDAASVGRLAIRPVTVGARGGWIKGNLTWQNVGYQGTAAGFEPAQTQWFAQVNAVKGSIPGGLHEYGSDWLTLDGFASSLLWALLAEADARGIALVGTTLPIVELGESAAIGFDARHRGEELVLAPHVIIDDTSHAVQNVGLVGEHGVYSYDFDAGRIVLARLTAPATRVQRALIERPAPLRIDGSELHEFLEEHYPTLARSVRVTSSDESFTPPPTPPPTLVLTTRFEPGQSLRIDAEWELSDRRRMPLRVPDSAFLDPASERMPASAVVETLRSDVAGAALLTARDALRATTNLRGLEAAEFCSRVLPLLNELRHVRIDTIGVKPDYREVRDAPVLTVSSVESESNDWFDLGVIVTVEGKKVPFGPLFRALSQGKRKLLLIDNSYLSLDQPVFAPLRELIEEAGTLEEWETGIRISRYQAALWVEFEDLADQSEAAVSWRATVDGLRTVSAAPPVPIPPSFTGELRPYQIDGFRWLAFLHEHGLGGILADDMGLGKTAQALALIAHVVDRPRGAHEPFLVVAPTSVVSNWVREAARFTPTLRVVTLSETSGKSGRAVADAAARADIVLTSYAVLRLDAAQFTAQSWGGLVLDEAQFVKNAASKSHRAARDIRAPFRLAVTGTPIENNLSELWALLQITAPGLFPSAREFGEKYRRPIEVNQDAQRLARLRRRVRPFMLRRTKDAVAPELPAKQEQVLEIPLDERHRRIYDTHLQRERQKILGLVDDLDRNRFIVFRSLTLLRMLSLDAALIDPVGYRNVPSAKLDVLLEQLEDIVGEGHQALVFSQFTSFLERAATRLDAHGIRYSYLDGTTRRRGEVIDGFRRGETSVFLISLKAGGFGLNLTEADYVFLLDPWWNPATEAQAVDRTHRIGQTKQVMVYRMVAEGTIEDKVMALKEKKAELFAAVMDDGAFFGEALSAADIRSLLQD